MLLVILDENHNVRNISVEHKANNICKSRSLAGASFSPQGFLTVVVTLEN